MIRCVLTIVKNGWAEIKKRIISVRFLTSVILVVTLVCAMSTGIDKFMLDKQECITPWMAPHFFNNKYFVTFYGFIVCNMYSDVPFTNRNELYYVLRKGKKTWCKEKIFGIIMEAAMLAIVAFASSILIFVPMIRFDTDWGKVIHTLAYSNNLSEYNIFGNASSVILSRYSALQAMCICFFMVWIVSSIIGLLMFAISLYCNRTAAVSTAAVVIGLNLSEGNYISSKWLAYITPFNWCRLGLHGENILVNIYYPTLRTCITLCCILFICMIVAVLTKTRHMEFDWNKED